jgi:hypothetical protein
LYESWSKKVDNGELVDRTEEKAAAEAEVTLLEFDDILLEALGCLYLSCHDCRQFGSWGRTAN